MHLVKNLTKNMVHERVLRVIRTQLLKCKRSLMICLRTTNAQSELMLELNESVSEEG